jgi:hypothetical protein
MVQQSRKEWNPEPPTEMLKLKQSGFALGF